MITPAHPHPFPGVGFPRYHFVHTNPLLRSLDDQLREQGAGRKTAEVALSAARGQAAVMEGQLRSMQRSMDLGEQFQVGGCTVG